MDGASTLLGRTVANDVLDLDDRGARGLGLGGDERGSHLIEVVSVVHVDGIPVHGTELAEHVLVIGLGEWTIARHVVGVIENREATKAELTSDGRGLHGHALLKVTITANGVGVMVDDVEARTVESVGEVCLGHGHTHGHREALPKRTRRSLDPRRMTVLGVTGAAAAQLTEGLEVIHGEIVTTQVEQGVEQHGCMTTRENEAVAVEPGRIGRVVTHVMAEQLVAHGRRAEWGSHVAVVRAFHGVDDEAPHRRDGLVVNWTCHVLLPLADKRT